MSAFLTPSHLENARRRRPSSGYTRFQEAIEGYNLYEAAEWTEHSQCPYNRFGKNGKPPLVSAANRLYQELKQDPSEVGPMPKWYREVYPRSSEEEWVRSCVEQNEKSLAKSHIIFEACLANVDWKEWKSPQVEALLAVLPIGSNKEILRHGLLQRVLDAGLPVDRLQYQGRTITPAMNSLLRHPWRHEAQEWAKHPMALDPPNDGPGFLSVLCMQWSRGLSSERGYYEEAADIALQRGSSINRPVCDETWMEQEEEKKKEIRLYGIKAYHPMPTLLAQMQTLDSPRLLASVSTLHANDNNRIHALITLMRRTGDVHARRGAYEDQARKEEHATQLLRMLEGPAENEKSWVAMGKKLMEAYFIDLWSSIPASANPLPEKVRKRLMQLVGTPKLDRSIIHNATLKMLTHLRVFEIMENMELVQEDMARMGISRAQLQGTMVATMLNFMVGSEYHQGKQMMAMGQLLAQVETLPLDTHESITRALFEFPAASLPVVYLQPLVQQLEDKGWKASPMAWAMLHQRLGDLNGKDSAEVLMFLGDVAARHCTPIDETIFNPVFPSPQHSSTLDRPEILKSHGYEEVCMWDRQASLQAHAYICKRAIGAMEDCNARIWGDRQSLMQRIASFLQRAMVVEDGEGKNILLDMLSDLHDAGAHPALEVSEEGVSGDWVGELASNHPFHETWAKIEQSQLQENTVPHGNRVRSRRL